LEGAIIDGLVLVTEVVKVGTPIGPPPTAVLALAGTWGNFLFLNDKATGF
jgi:hypothetical protein